jgi:hypothetical protein
MRLLISLNDVGSADPDDLMAVLVLHQALLADPKLHVVVVTTHFRAPARADLLCRVLAHPRLEVLHAPAMSKAEFREENPLWPSALFGWPFPSANSTTKPWFPDFGKAFEALEPLAQAQPVGDRLRELIGQCTPDEPAIVCLCSPLAAHRLLPRDAESANRMRWVAMGGAQANGTPGYNWGLSPAALVEFQEYLARTQSECYCITSALSNECRFPLELFDQLASKARTPQQRAVVDECRRSFRADALDQQPHKKLGDPLTVWLGLQLIRGAVPPTERGRYELDALCDSYLRCGMRWCADRTGPVGIPTALDLAAARQEITAALVAFFE